MSVFTDHFLKGTHAARPAAGVPIVGAKYACTDHGLVYETDGTTWSTWFNPGPGTDPEVIRDTIAAALTAGSGVTITPNDGADTITIAASGSYTDEQARDAIGAALVAGAGMTITVDDAGDTITLAASGGGGGASWTAAINDPLSSTTNLLTALSGTWAINAGVLRQSGAGGGQRAHGTVVVPTAIRAVECEMAYISGSGTRRIGLNVSWRNVASNNLFVYLESTNGTTWTLKAEDEGVVLIFTSTATISYAGSGYVRLGVIQSGTVLDFYINGVWVDSCNAISSNQWQAGKYVGLQSLNAVADFKNLKAWSFLPNPF